MSECKHRSRFWLWFCIVMLMLTNQCNYNELQQYHQMRDAQRRIAELEQRVSCDR